MTTLLLFAALFAAQPAEVCLTAHFNFVCAKAQVDEDVYQEWTSLVYDVVEVEFLVNREPRLWRAVGTVRRMQEMPAYLGGAYASESYEYEWDDGWWRDGAPGEFTVEPLKGKPFKVESLEEGARRLVELWTGRRVAELNATWRSKQ